MDPIQTMTSANGANFVPKSGTSEAVISSDFDTFLKMLTVQMQNQDPLNPTDSAEYAQQLATFSGVEQAVLTNDLLSALMVQMNTTGMAQMADWVGKEARAATPSYFDGSPITIAPNPAAIADKVELVVTDANGVVVQRSEIPKSADSFEWAGVGAGGSPLPNGVYTFTIVSYSNGEIALSEIADVYSRVEEVRSENGESILMLRGGIAVPATQISALRAG